MNAGNYTIDAHCWPKADGSGGLHGSFECDTDLSRIETTINETQAVSVTFYRYFRGNSEQSTDLAQGIYFPSRDEYLTLYFYCCCNDQNVAEAYAWEMRYITPDGTVARLGSGTETNQYYENNSGHLFYNTDTNESYSAIQYVWYDPDSTHNGGCTLSVRDVQMYGYPPPPPVPPPPPSPPPTRAMFSGVLVVTVVTVVAHSLYRCCAATSPLDMPSSDVQRIICVSTLINENSHIPI